MRVEAASFTTDCTFNEGDRTQSLAGAAVMSEDGSTLLGLVANSVPQLASQQVSVIRIDNLLYKKTWR